MKKDLNTPEVEVNTPETPEVEAKDTTVEPETTEKEPEKVEKEEVKEETISEMSGLPDEDDGKIDRNVFVSEKKARKDAERELKALKESIEEGASDKDVSKEVDAIADEHNIDPKFLQDFANSIKAQAERDLDEKIDLKFDSLNSAKTFEEKFSRAFNIALDRGPEFKDIANPSVIKALAKLPENSKKTVSQILEDTYGSAIKGKATIETTTPNGGKSPDPLDFDKAQKDGAYFAEVMSDPKKKAEYNEIMLKKGF